MKILGLNAFHGDSSAAVLTDGRLTAAVEEERYNRVKHWAGLPVLAVAGLLVGFGATWGSGCTSGHGVCGLSRLSPRSLVATLAFMATGMATVFAMRHLG